MAKEKEKIISFILFSLLLHGIVSEESKATHTLPQTVQDNDIVMAMLKIVDTKFDSISNRMSGLEMAIQGLLQSNLRESRMIDRNLRGVNGIMQGVHDHLKQLDTEQGLLRKAVISMSTSVENVYEKTTDFIKHFDYSGTTKKLSDEQISRLERKITDQTVIIKEAINKTSNSQKQSLQSEKKRINRSLVNISDGVLLVDEKVDAVFTILEKVADTKQLKEVNANLNRVTSSVYKVLARNSTRECGKRLLVMERSMIESSHLLKNISQTQHELATSRCPVRHPREKVEFVEALTQSEEIADDIDNHIRETGEDLEYHISKDQWNLLFRTLANMTIDLADSINYYRHTGDLVETMLSRTSTYAREQTLTKRLVQRLLAVVKSENISQIDFNIPDKNNNVTYAQTNNTVMNLQVTDSKELTSLLQNMSEVIKNSSHLLELLTELAELSTETLAKTSTQMSESVRGLDDIKTSFRLFNQSKHHEETANNTKNTFQLLEAVARSTGWIPYIYHKSLSLENRMNISNRISDKIFRKVSDCEPFHSRNERKEDIENKIQQNPIMCTPNATNLASDETLQKIYSTSVKVERILPALTKLVAEPEPMYSLTNGTNPSQGRVEVYMKGRWGTICQENFGHAEASTICRHLGYPGGMAAGVGYFGPGDGLFYAMNTSCLQTGWCASIDIVENIASCDHDNDVSVICEHMIQFRHGEDNNEISAGLIEINHHSSWRLICGNKWTSREARVVCKQLGYTDGWVIDGGNGNKTERQWLSGVTCNGDELRIDLCEHNNWQMKPSCIGNRAAAVACR